MNNGDGTFTAAASSPGGRPTKAVVFGDVDGDGDLDIYLANESNYANMLYINDGNGAFVETGAAAGVALKGRSQDVFMADVDGDGDLDIVVAQLYDANVLFLNDGTGTFSDASSAISALSSSDPPRKITAADFDGDGDIDILGTRPYQLLLNDGAGNFADVAASEAGLPNTCVPLRFCARTTWRKPPVSVRLPPPRPFSHPASSIPSFAHAENPPCWQSPTTTATVVSISTACRLEPAARMAYSTSSTGTPAQAASRSCSSRSR